MLIHMYVPAHGSLPDLAWDKCSRWLGPAPVPAYRPPLMQRHQCHGDPTCGTMLCLWCRQRVPWCYAGDSEGPRHPGGLDLELALCDTCWHERFQYGRDNSTTKTNMTDEVKRVRKEL